jgi:hypothetical protein
MNKERRRPGSIAGELDTAFATVQAARLRHELGYEDAQSVARECVSATAERLNRSLLKNPVSPVESHLIQARLKALIGAAARIPGPAATAENEQQPRKPDAPLGR